MRLRSFRSGWVPTARRAGQQAHKGASPLALELSSNVKIRVVGVGVVYFKILGNWWHGETKEKPDKSMDARSKQRLSPQTCVGYLVVRASLFRPASDTVQRRWQAPLVVSAQFWLNGLPVFNTPDTRRITTS